MPLRRDEPGAGSHAAPRLLGNIKMIDAWQEIEIAEAQRMFDPFNRAGAAVTLLADGEELDLGPGVEFRVLRAAADGAGGIDFWLMWKALGYQDGPQFTHTVLIVSVAGGRRHLRLEDSTGQVLLLGPYEDRARWRAWQEYRRGNKTMFAETDAALLAEHQAAADNWPAGNLQ
jgi:hypothetical protein